MLKLINKSELTQDLYYCINICMNIADNLEIIGMLYIDNKMVLFPSARSDFNYAELNQSFLDWTWGVISKEDIDEEVYIDFPPTEEDIRKLIDINLSKFNLSNYNYQITRISDSFYRISFTFTLIEIELDGGEAFLYAEDNNPHRREEVNFLSSLMSDLEQLYIDTSVIFNS